MAQHRKKDIKYQLHYLRHFFLLCTFNTATSRTIVETLPGYPGTLPFKLETGYISVGESDEVQLFYYFVESETDPKSDPLLLWLTGGPGCSGLYPFFYAIGPLAIDAQAFDGRLPSLTLNPYSWTKVANIIFIDSPVGTGFSYATTSDGYNSSDTKSAKDNYMFLRTWLSIHPEFVENFLYIGGDSYAGKILPIVALEIAKGNEAGLEPRMSLQGYITGNGRVDFNMERNEMIPYAHRMALISDENFELAKGSCLGEYASPDPNNVKCNDALRLINECINMINPTNILEPQCNFVSSKPNKYQWGEQLILDDGPVANFLRLNREDKPPFCSDKYATSYVWANNETVQAALHIRKGTITEWKRCDTDDLIYEDDVESVLKYHQLLSEKGFQVLAYSGDHDMAIPYLSTLKWIRELNLTIDDEWRPWNVDGQVAGYTEKYKNDQAYITFATVKGAGHTAPMDKGKQCFAMFKRWIGLHPL